MKTKLLILIAVIALIAVAAGCQTTFDSAIGRDVTTFDPCVVATVDTGFEIAGTAADVAEPFVPPGYRWIYELVALTGLGAKLAWDKVKTGKIIRGSKAAAVALNTLKVTPTTVFANVSPGLKSAEIAGAIMPDNL